MTETTFGKYFLTEKLATGGMAEIYLAKLVGPGGFEKQLVIKQIHPNLSGQRHFVDLFVTEAKTLVTLAHGNIVPVYELGVVGETYFIAMEYIDGPTLYRLTERINQRDERMTPTVAAWITARILEGLDYAHRKGDGVIHRDLSPRNVMLSRDGEVKLVDFGIAVTLGADADGEATQSAPTGSFPYMSPEQVRRDALTQQTDLFSVGVLMWEMLVGQRLFARPDADATLAAVASGPIPRPSTRIPEIPAKLDEVVMRALERDTTTRWRTAGDMLEALQRHLYSLDETPNSREVAALVARFCPPETRRLPTNLEAIEPVEPDDQGTARHGSDPPASGPQTAVIPRAPAPRQQTFATHVDLKDLLERATPLFAIEAIRDDVVEPTSPASEDPTPPPKPLGERTDQPPDGYVSSLRLGVPGRDAPSRGGIFVAGLGAIGLSAGAIYVFYAGRGAVLAQGDARPADISEDAGHPDASTPPTDAGGLIDVSQPDAVTDAHVSHDAMRLAVGDARGVGLVDATTLDARSAATATLKIGADPWGEITIDGVPRGRTPAAIAVPSGHHVVEITYSGEDPPRKRTFPIDVAANETLPLQADFTKP